MKLVSRTCPRCQREFTSRPALSRIDNETFICPECGTRESLESIGVTDPAEQDHIIELTKRGGE